MSKGIGEGDEEGAPWSKLDVQPRTVAGLTRCRGAPLFRGELQDFEAMITPVGVHDDRVISVAMAVRWGLQRPLPERGDAARDDLAEGTMARCNSLRCCTDWRWFPHGYTGNGSQSWCQTAGPQSRPSERVLA